MATYSRSSLLSCNNCRKNNQPFYSCCGKSICDGCKGMMGIGTWDICPFCNNPATEDDEETIKKVKNLTESASYYNIVDKRSSSKAHYVHACWYVTGRNGLVQDYQKATELFRKAGKLGSAVSYFNLGIAYDRGYGVEVDKEKAKHYYELAAKGGELEYADDRGHLKARHTVGVLEEEAGNHRRSMEHFMIAARAGYYQSLRMVRKGVERGYIYKDQYEYVERAYHGQEYDSFEDD